MDELRAIALLQLVKLGFDVPINPHGGVFLWARWAGNATANDLAASGIDVGINLIPGSFFSPSGRWTQYIRFNCTLMQKPGFYKALQHALNRAEYIASKS